MGLVISRTHPHIVFYSTVHVVVLSIVTPLWAFVLTCSVSTLSVLYWAWLGFHTPSLNSALVWVNKVLTASLTTSSFYLYRLFWSKTCDYYFEDMVQVFKWTAYLSYSIGVIQKYVWSGADLQRTSSVDERNTNTTDFGYDTEQPMSKHTEVVTILYNAKTFRLVWAALQDLLWKSFNQHQLTKQTLHSPFSFVFKRWVTTKSKIFNSN